MNKKNNFNNILKDIKSIKIQGARNVAKAGFRAYKMSPKKSSKNKIISLRPTEPLLKNALNLAEKISYKDFLNMLKNNQNKINKEVSKIIKQDAVIFTHCHSSSVVQALIYAKKQGKRFEVYNTETRPLYQGRKTARELRNAGIRVTMFVDSAASIALTKSQNTKKVDLILLGVDAILPRGIINKVGSGMFAQIAKLNKTPVYILSDSLKYSPNINLEQRDKNEVWETSSKINIKNPSFEFVPKKFIKGIISEFGNLTYDKFLKKLKNN